ncbi:MAG: hypothetical protein IJB97_00975 [Clostridia bacterium]|nr:hypothetical protein [Clostridia bacterium]
MRRNGIRSLKKYAAIGLSLVFAVAIPLSFSACEKVEDYMPETYGEWEGNYIYKGNGRSKTTGEDYEKLVESVTVDGATMYAAGCVDYEIVGDEIYMALYLSIDESVRDARIANSLVKYDVKEKTQTLIRYFPKSSDGGTESMALTETVEIDEIVCVTDTEIIVCTSKWNGNSYYYKHNYIGVNFDGSLSENDYSDLYGKRLYGDEYFVENTKTGISYRTWENAEYTTVFTCAQDEDFTYEYLEKGDREGLLIYAYQEQYVEEKDDTVYVCGGVWFYDFGSDEKFSLTDGIENLESVRLLEGGDYFVAYEENEVKWYEQRGCISKVEHLENACGNCVLYEISYGETVTATPVYTFDETMSFAGSSYLTEDKIYFQAGRYESAKWVFKDGGYKYYYYALDRETLKLSKTESEEFFAADDVSEEEYAKSLAVTCGEYTYYLKIHTLQLGIWAGKEQVLTLMRINPDNTEEALQFGESGAIQLEGAKYCEEMWGSDGYEAYPENIRDFIVRSY